MRDGGDANLIPLYSRDVDGEVKETIHARELYEFLEVRRDFSNWIKGRIEKYGFSEGVDFIVSPDLASDNPNPRIDYFLTIDMAKELSMIENNPKGTQARRWFIAREKRLREIEQGKKALLPKNPIYTAILQAQEATNRALAAMAAEQEAIKADVEAIKAERPPEGKYTVEDWLKRFSKPYLPRPVLKNLKAFCKEREDPERVRPGWSNYPLLYYKPETIERAYALVTKQISFIEESGVSYGNGKKRNRHYAH